MKKLWFALLLVLILAQCSEDDSKSKTTCRLVRQKYASIEYYDNGQVFAIRQLDADNEPVENGTRREFEFEDGKLVRIDERNGDELSRYFLFEYSLNQIIQKEYFDEDPDVDYIVTYSLDEKGQIIQKVNESVNSPGYSFTQSYQNEAGNVVRVITTSDEDQLNFNQEFEFDSKRNPNAITGFEMYFVDDIFSYRTQNSNNILKSTTTYEGEEPRVSTYSYTYDSQGYAIEMFANGGPDRVWFYDFECK
ncbi:MAG: hypothetical protein JNK18_05490 [Cyclobacteriaceae bacterium]|nr:hypothetical protein [Cyclobacteriaceae bacterium]